MFILLQKDVTMLSKHNLYNVHGFGFLSAQTGIGNYGRTKVRAWREYKQQFIIQCSTNYMSSILVMVQR